jgi:hypothetical protein
MNCVTTAATAPDTDISECVDCRMNCPAGRKRVGTCDGTQSQDPVTCEICEDGTFASAGDATTCETCEDGFACYGGTRVPCPPGYKCVGGLKIPCQKDGLSFYYQNQEGQNECLECGTGFMVGGEEGARSSCTTCSNVEYAGSYCTGAAVPFTCGLGFKCPGDGKRYECADHEYADQEGSTACEHCKEGDVATVLDQCAGLDAGSYIDLDTDETKDCEPGYECPYGSHQRHACPKGSFQDQSGQGSCKDCGADRWNNQTKSYSEDSCATIMPGQHGLPAGSARKTNAVTCEAGRSCAGGSAAQQPCNSNTMWSSSGADKCTPCTAGSYTGGGTNETRTSCTPCDKGEYCDGSGDKAVCPAGAACGETSMSTFTACAAGTFQASAGKSACDDCEKGKYQGEQMQLACNACPIGSSCPTTGMTAHAPCSRGSAQGQEEQDSCEDCDVGTFQSATGQAACVACDAGNECSDRGLQSQRACDAGKYQVAVTWQCEFCSPGTVQPNRKSTSCTACTVGKVQAFTGQRSCDECERGQFQGESGKTVCAECAPGSYQNANNAAACMPCPQGNSCPGLRDSAGVLTGSKAAEPCDPGTYQDENSKTSCKPCRAGAFQQATGQPTCLACPKGSSCAASGLDAATPCPRGSFQANTGGVACDLCSAGTFGPLGGAIGCATCDPGQRCSAPGLEQPTPCAKGKYQPDALSTSCLRCGAGTYNDVEGQADCMLFTDNVGTYGADKLEEVGINITDPDAAPAFQTALPCRAGWYCPGDGTRVKAVGAFFVGSDRATEPEECDEGFTSTQGIEDARDDYNENPDTSVVEEDLVIRSDTPRTVCIPCLSGYTCTDGRLVKNPAAAAASSGSEEGGSAALVGALAAAVVVVAVVGFIIYRQRSGAGSTAGKRDSVSNVDGAGVSFENPLYDEKETGAQPPQAGDKEDVDMYDDMEFEDDVGDDDDGLGLYDEPAGEDGVGVAQDSGYMDMDVAEEDELEEGMYDDDF